MRPHLLLASFSTAVILVVTPGVAASQTLTTIDVPNAVHTAALGINDRSRQHGFLLTPPGEVEDISGSASPDGTRVPLASVIFDNELAMWTLGPGEEILRDGVQAAGGYGSQILWFQGAVYVLGDDSNWWRWTGSTWVFAGPQDPRS